MSPSSDSLEYATLDESIHWRVGTNPFRSIPAAPSSAVHEGIDDTAPETKPSATGSRGAERSQSSPPYRSATNEARAAPSQRFEKTPFYSREKISQRTSSPGEFSWLRDESNLSSLLDPNALLAQFLAADRNIKANNIKANTRKESDTKGVHNDRPAAMQTTADDKSPAGHAASEHLASNGPPSEQAVERGEVRQKRQQRNLSTRVGNAQPRRRSIRRRSRASYAESAAEDDNHDEVRVEDLVDGSTQAKDFAVPRKRAKSRRKRGGKTVTVYSDNDDNSSEKSSTGGEGQLNTDKLLKMLPKRRRQPEQQTSRRGKENRQKYVESFPDPTKFPLISIALCICVQGYHFGQGQVSSAIESKFEEARRG